MKRMRFRGTDPEVSKIGFGDIPSQRPPYNKALKTINRALDLGVNFTDISISYGNCDIRIGKMIKDRRDGVILATKGSWRNKDAAWRAIEDNAREV